MKFSDLHLRYILVFLGTAGLVYTLAANGEKDARVVERERLAALTTPTPEAPTPAPVEQVKPAILNIACVEGRGQTVWTAKEEIKDLGLKPGYMGEIQADNSVEMFELGMMGWFAHVEGEQVCGVMIERGN